MKLLQLRCLSWLLVGAALSDLLTAVAGPALAQAPAIEQQTPSAAIAVPVEEFHQVRAKKKVFPQYPFELSSDRQEGWVVLNFMVSPEGRPYEAYVSQSVGDKAFQREALRAISNWEFEPAVLRAMPVESAVSMKMKFEIEGGSGGARSDFVDLYTAIGRAINKNDKAAADALKAKLHISNLYEDAYFGLVEYRYAERWGSEAQRMAGLRRAIAEEATAHYLPRSTFAAALEALLPLEINSHDFCSALLTWGRLQQSGIDAKELSRLKPVMERIEALRSDDRAFDVSGEISDAAWSLKLFKHHFRPIVSEGRISDIKLLCERKFLAFQYDPDFDYAVSGTAGDCTIEVNGDPGTTFKLVQH